MELGEIRERIDTVDDELLKLFLDRMELSEQVAKYKIEHNLPILNKTREREILTEVGEKAGADMEVYARNLFTTLFGLSKARQSELFAEPTAVRKKIESALDEGADVFPRGGTVACQGVEGSNSQAACDKILPRGSIMYVKSFDKVFDAVGSGLCKFGVLPIENSVNGSVRQVYELLQDRDFSIVRSARVHIRHELMAARGAKLSDIKTIYSHAQAIGQCSRFLAGLPDAAVVPCDNTAVAAKAVAESGDPRCAAISSHRCAELYGLSPLASDIQDSDNNYTRFVCVTKRPTIYAGANKLSLVVSCDNEPGALESILSRINALGVNMSKLESCPVTGRDFEFIFFLELDASVREQGVVAMLESLERMCAGFKFLGCYSEV